MKTLKLIFAFFAFMCFLSCGTYYRMVTTIDGKGNTQRELYADGDSAFLAGDLSSNPFLFDVTSDWQVTSLDSTIKYDFFGTEKSLNVKVSKHTNSIENFSKELQYDVDNQSLVVPQESLAIRKGWFYTRYSLKVVYKKLEYEVPISIDNYLSKEEQMLWTQGDFSNYKLVNGSEMSEYLSDISEKFTKWHADNLIEVGFQLIRKYVEKYDLDMDKENIHKQLRDNIWMEDDVLNINPDAICNFLDSFYKTTYFSNLYKNHSKVLDKEFNDIFSAADLISNAISYEIKLPGELVLVSDCSYHSGTIFWKVDGMRLLFDDLTFTAESWIKNKWAFWVTGLLLGIGVVSTILLVRNRKKF